MKLIVIPDDQIIVKNDEALKCDFVLPKNIHAIHWNDNSGHIEYNNGNLEKQILKTKDIPKYQNLLLAFKKSKMKNIPSEYHTWNEVLEEFEITPENQILKDEKNAEIKAQNDKRETEINNNVLSNLKLNDVDLYINENINDINDAKNFLKSLLKLFIVRT